MTPFILIILYVVALAFGMGSMSKWLTKLLVSTVTNVAPASESENVLSNIRLIFFIVTSFAFGMIGNWFGVGEEQVGFEVFVFAFGVTFYAVWRAAQIINALRSFGSVQAHTES